MQYAILVLTMLLIVPQMSFALETPATISVHGTATVTAKAEFATIHAQLKVFTASVQESYAAATRTLTEISAALLPLGVTREHIVASAVSQGTEYDWSQNTRTVSGYYSGCSLQITVTALEDTYRIHALLANFPDLSIGHTEYGRDDESQLQITALQQALQNAQAKAGAMATTVGAQLGMVRNITESQTTSFPMAKMEARLATESQDPAAVTTTGTITIRGEVTVDFAISNALNHVPANNGKQQ